MKRGATLTEAVRGGSITDYKTLKREYRSRSLEAHPDTSGRDDAVFVLLKADFDEAARVLRMMRPLSVTKAETGRPAYGAGKRPFDQGLFLELIKKAQAAGLPSRRLSATVQNRRLIARIKKEALNLSETLMTAVRLYYGLHDRTEDSDYSSQQIKHRLQQGISNFLDSHYNRNPQAARFAISFFDEAQSRMAKVSGSVFSYMLPFVEWMRGVIANSKLLD